MSIENINLISTNLGGGELDIPKVDLEYFKKIRDNLKRKTTEGLLNIGAKYNFSFGAVVLGGEKELKLSDSDCAYIIPCLRNVEDKIANNKVRKAFYQALKERYIQWNSGNSPNEIKSALKLDDFAIVNGEVTSEHPLTAYRISKVLDALDEYEKVRDNQNIKNAINAVRVFTDKSLLEKNDFDALQKIFDDMQNRFEVSIFNKNEKNMLIDMLIDMSNCFCFFNGTTLNDDNYDNEDTKKILRKGLMYGVYCLLRRKLCKDYQNCIKYSNKKNNKEMKIAEVHKFLYDILKERHESLLKKSLDEMPFESMAEEDKKDEKDINSLKYKILNIKKPKARKLNSLPTS